VSSDVRLGEQTACWTYARPRSRLRLARASRLGVCIFGETRDGKWRPA